SQVRYCFVSHLQSDATLLQSFHQRFEHYAYDAPDMLLVEGMEYDDIIHPVEEFGAEGPLEFAHNIALHIFIVPCRIVTGDKPNSSGFCYHPSADIGCHYYHGIPEVDSPSL